MNLYRKMYFLILFSTGFVLASNHTAAQNAEQFKNVTIEIKEVGSGVYMLAGRGGNIGISVGEDGVYMVDDQFAPLTEKIKAAIAKLSDKPIRFVINTHWHSDHTGGNENLGKEGVVIVAHENVYQRMSTENFVAFFQRTIPAAPAQALPVITFNDTVTFHLNGQTVHVFHQKNAHTDGDSIVHFKEANIIHTGDVFVNGLYPIIDISSKGSMDGIINAVQKILKLANDETSIIPGHGPLADKNDLLTYRDLLNTVKERMKKLIDEGKTMEQIIELKPNADFDSRYGNGLMTPDLFLQVLYKSLTDN